MSLILFAIQCDKIMDLYYTEGKKAVIKGPNVSNGVTVIKKDSGKVAVDSNKLKAGIIARLSLMVRIWPLVVSLIFCLSENLGTFLY